MLFRRLRWALLGLATVLVTGTAGYMIIEQWTWQDALWMVFLTITTVGYGEVRPLSNGGRLLTMGYMVLSLGLVTYAFSQLARYVAEGGLRHDLIERRRRYRMERLKDHVIVIGFGRLGREVVEELVANRVDLCIIDENDALFDEVPSQSVLLVGDGTHDQVLLKAGIERARGIAIATPHSATNVYVTLAARQLSPNIDIVTRIDDPDAYDKARRAGADRIVTPFGVGAHRMAQALLHPESSQLVDQVTTQTPRDMAMQDVSVGADATRWHGTLRALNLRAEANVLIVAIRRSDGELISMPGPDVDIRPQDVLIVVGKPTDVSRFKATVA
ncbi:MAG: TrkA family potassium uptake protein [Myxococcota bacterium]